MGKNRGKQAAAGSTIASRQSKTAGEQNKVIYQKRLNIDIIFLGVDMDSPIFVLLVLSDNAPDG